MEVRYMNISNIFRVFSNWIKPEKEVPQDIMEYLESVQDMQTVYEARRTLDSFVWDYMHEQGLWRITEEVKSLKPIPEESIKNEKNVFLLRIYYGEYGETYCFGISGFIKKGRKWTYIGRKENKRLNRLPKVEEIAIRFTDKHNQMQTEDCQGFYDFYYKY